MWNGLSSASADVLWVDVGARRTGARRPEHPGGGSLAVLSVGDGADGAPPPQTFTSLSPNRNPMGEGSPVRSRRRPPPRGRSPTVPTGVHLFVPRTRSLATGDGRRSPLRPPAPLTSATPRSASGGRHGRAWWCMQAPEVLAIHAVPHPNPRVRRVGFALNDPYVEPVRASVVGPSALLVLLRVSVLWREREAAVVDLRELGQSLGLGRSLAHSGLTWRTIERLVGFGMAHWLPGDSSACASRWRRSMPASSHG
jgi:hypothetical protein